MFSIARAIRSRCSTQAWQSFSRRYSAPADLTTDGERTIYAKLTDRFSPSELLVQDVSGGCGSFYAITIASDAFKGLPIVKQHRLVNDVLKEEIKGIHGLQVTVPPIAIYLPDLTVV
ncbi:bola-like protein [Punctularia strigosozonata HHB-11173 SS5]|uniref:bola-like protein n=1 Tax=Punctularia strigosozonata (strain HHB-11173) TaxID=741275 RepID=UPI0004417CAB|nr:bola-like protein [Punctularia strigosozonata HHB-11173 SS5]EIN10833.1 bola-like protein [Punctularia strigosozonata HHB-11173 SS5]